MKNIWKLLFIFGLGLATITASGQVEKPSIYDPAANARNVISKAIHKAKVENKHVLLQVGGNW